MQNVLLPLLFAAILFMILGTESKHKIKIEAQLIKWLHFYTNFPSIRSKHIVNINHLPLDTPLFHVGTVKAGPSPTL